MQIGQYYVSLGSAAFLIASRLDSRANSSMISVATWSAPKIRSWLVALWKFTRGGKARRTRVHSQPRSCGDTAESAGAGSATGDAALTQSYVELVVPMHDDAVALAH